MGGGQSKQQGEHPLPLQKGKTFVVTGANSGLGYIVAKELCRAGGHVVVCARSSAKSLGACREIEKELASGISATATAAVPNDATVTSEKKDGSVITAGSEGGRLEVGVIDLSSLESVKQFAATLAKRPIHCLVNNAGVMNIPTRELSPDGFEMQLATNCLGHYALSVLLVPSLRLSPGAGGAGNNHMKPRVVNVSSIKAHDFTPPPPCSDSPSTVDFKKDTHYNDDKVYSESKLLNLIINNALAQKCPDLMVVGCHPGVCSTNLFRHKYGWLSSAFQSPETGAKSIIQAAVGAEAGGGGGPDEKQNDANNNNNNPHPQKKKKGKDNDLELKGVVSGQTYYGPAGWFGGPSDLLMPAPAHDAAQLKRYWSALEDATNIQL